MAAPDPRPTAAPRWRRWSTAVDPRAARSPDGFYGWHVVAASALVYCLTAPGQTAAVSVFIDPMIGELGVSRSAISTCYLIGTLTGAVAMPWVGRAVDRHGVRRAMLVIATLFGAVLLLLGRVDGLVGLTLGFVGIRMLGQGALGLTATLAAASWFERRRGLALSVVAAVGAAGISLAPVLVERLIAAHGWRTAWVVEGLAVWLVVLPLAALAMTDRPDQLGQRVDGTARGAGPAVAAPVWGLDLRAALREPFFWVLCAGVAVSGMLATAVAFHQVSLLGERGLSPTQAAANFLPQTVAGIAATLAVGSVIDRVGPRWLIGATMAALAGGLAWGVVVAPGLSAIGFGVAIGAAGAAIRAVESAGAPRYFGIAHVGSLRGVIAAVAVGSSAFGPVLFALVRDAAGSYAAVLLGSALLPLAVLVAGFLVRPPVRDTPYEPLG